jgi:uncharacterized protein YndB with AHSA1/START domain
MVRVMNRNLAARILLPLLVALPARAAVTDSATNGFSVVEIAHISATPEKIYAALVTPSRWWSSEHTFSHDAANLSLDPVAGGCWCEKLANGGTVQHLVVVQAIPSKALIMRGALGPLQGLGVEGALTISLKPVTDGTDISFTYNVGGYLRDGLGGWGAPVDRVLGEQVTRLKSFVESDSPDIKR